MEVQYIFNESFPASVRLQLGELRCFLVRKSAEELFSTKRFYFYLDCFFHVGILRCLHGPVNS